jgi:hypothetical protein
MRRARCGGEFSDVRQHVVEVPHGEANERNRLTVWHCEPTAAPLACDRREFVEDAPADAQRPVHVPPGDAASGGRRESLSASAASSSTSGTSSLAAAMSRGSQYSG